MRDPPTTSEVFLSDEPDLAERTFEYFRLGTLSISNSGSLAAYGTDTNGSERYTLAVKNLETGRVAW